MSTAIEFNNVSKQYKLGLVSTKTLSHDLNRWWQTKILRKEDPYLKIGSVNDRSAKADSDYVWALKDIDFKVEQGDVVGIIGKNGAGKSTLLKLLSRVTNPTTGTIRARGRIASLLEVGTGFHPELTGRENIYMNGSIMGMTKQEITRKLDEIVDFSGCERYIDTPVKRYSSGMTVRLGFAIAAHLDPEILVVDEVLAVGDADFQKKAIGKMQDVSKGEGRTVLFVSHNMASIRALCNSGVLLEHGKVVDTGFIDNIVDKYLSMHDDSIINIPLTERNDRKGDKRAILSNLQIKVKDNYVNNVQMMTPIDIEMKFNSSEEINNVEIMFSIYNQHGLLVLSSNSKFAYGQEVSFNKGENKLNVSYNEFPLSCGLYKINVRVRDQYDKDIDWVENAYRFEIIENDIFETGKFYKDSSSIMILPHKWSF